MTVSVIDQGCQTRAQESDFFISSLGEMDRHTGTPLPSNFSHVNGMELANNHGYDWNKVSQYRREEAEDGRPSDRRKEARIWFKCVDDELERQYKQYLTAQELAFAKKVLAFQDKCHAGQFRVYGELRNGIECIVLVTEFLEIVEADDFWNDLLKFKEENKANLWIMDESENTERSYKTEGPPNYKMIEGTEVLGPNYGKVERQVELSWRIENLSADEMVVLQQLITNSFKNLWQRSGVTVS